MAAAMAEKMMIATGAEKMMVVAGAMMAAAAEAGAGAGAGAGIVVVVGEGEGGIVTTTPGGLGGDREGELEGFAGHSPALGETAPFMRTLLQSWADEIFGLARRKMPMPLTDATTRGTVIHSKKPQRDDNGSRSRDTWLRPPRRPKNRGMMDHEVRLMGCSILQR